MTYRTGYVIAASLAAAVALGLVIAASARAATCPDAPAAYTGTDDVVAELRLARAEAVDICVKQADDQDQARAQRTTLHDELVAIEDAIVSGNGSTAAKDVKLVSVEPAAADGLVGPKAESIVNDWNQTWWFIAGALVALVAGYALMRQVMPR